MAISQNSKHQTLSKALKNLELAKYFNNLFFSNLFSKECGKGVFFSCGKIRFNGVHLADNLLSSKRTLLKGEVFKNVKVTPSGRPDSIGYLKVLSNAMIRLDASQKKGGLLMYQPSRSLARRAFLGRRAKRRSQALPAPGLYKQGESIMKDSTRNVLIVALVTLTLGALCFGLVLVPLGITFLSESRMGSDPIINTSNPHIYAEPQEEGQMTTDGRITYTQSGKPNEQTVTGHIGKYQNLVVTAYELQNFAGDIYTGGVVQVIPGPYDLDKYPFVIKDGAATLVSKDSTQEKLDSMWVDFCRGDKNADETWWSYNPWALSHVFVPDEFYFPESTLFCFSEDEDNYPSFLPRP